MQTKMETKKMIIVFNYLFFEISDVIENRSQMAAMNRNYHILKERVDYLVCLNRTHVLPNAKMMN